MSENQDSKSSNINITKNCSKKRFDKLDFGKFIRKKRKKYNDSYKEQLSTRDLGKKLGIDYEMFRKILNQSKPTQKRDCIIAICVALRLEPKDIDEALRMYRYMPAFDIGNDRDEFIKSQLKKSPDITVEDLNRQLISNKFPGLDIYDKRDGKKKKTPEVTIDSQYKEIKSNVSTIIDSEHYYGDQYDSLCTRYNPSKCKCTGRMKLKDLKSENIIYLEADTYGNLFSEIHKVDDLPTQFENLDGTVESANKENVKRRKYETLDETGDLKEHYTKLIQDANAEKRRLLSVLDDTKNYQSRTSARLIDDHISIFSEEFNSFVPEINEYYVLIRTKGEYYFKVFDRSAFMHFYLSPDELKKYYGNDELEPKETYTLKQLSEKENDSGNKGRYKMLKREFNRLQDRVDELYAKLKEGKEFILNPDAIGDDPVELLRHYNIENDFEVVDNSNEECDKYNLLQEKTYTLTNGVEVTITLEDVRSAFKYGYPSIEEICRIKATYGSVNAVFLD